MFSFSGRLSRKNFILGSLLPMILIVPLGLFAAVTLVSLDRAREQGRAALLESEQKQADINQIIEQSEGATAPAPGTTTETDPSLQ